MKAWTLDQLIYAKEVCFPDTFLKLWTKHSGDLLEAEWHLMDFKRHGDLLKWIFVYSRADMERSNFGAIIDNVLADLIGNYPNNFKKNNHDLLD